MGGGERPREAHRLLSSGPPALCSNRYLSFPYWEGISVLRTPKAEDSTVLDCYVTVGTFKKKKTKLQACVLNKMKEED